MRLLQAGTKYLYWTNVNTGLGLNRDVSPASEEEIGAEASLPSVSPVKRVPKRAGAHSWYMLRVHVWRWHCSPFPEGPTVRGKCQGGHCWARLKNPVLEKSFVWGGDGDTTLWRRRRVWAGQSSEFKFPMTVGAFWKEVPLMVLFQWALRCLVVVLFFLARDFKGDSVLSNASLLSRKRKVITRSMLLYLKPSVGASGSILPRFFGAGCARLCQLMKISVTVEEQTCKQPLDISWKVKSKDLIPSPNGRRMGQ